MPVLQRIAKPSTHKGKKVLLSREPKLVESAKKMMLVAGRKTSSVVTGCMKDLHALKKPDSKMLSKRNDILPFENAVTLEAFSRKQLASLFVFGCHSKKRPHNLVFGRTYDHQLLDMMELGVQRYRGLCHFTSDKVAVGLKPCVLFVGQLFEQSAVHQRLKSLLLDMFHREQVSAVRLQGLEHVLLFAAHDDALFLRSYRILLKKSGCKTPRVELEEIGPSVDFKMRRTRLASDELFKLACRRPKQLKAKKVKNVSEDALGVRHGQIHIPRQHISSLQTRKMKGLRKTAAEKKTQKRRAEAEVETVPGKTRRPAR